MKTEEVPPINTLATVLITHGPMAGARYHDCTVFGLDETESSLLVRDHSGATLSAPLDCIRLEYTSTQNRQRTGAAATRKFEKLLKENPNVPFADLVERLRLTLVAGEEPYAPFQLEAFQGTTGRNLLLMDFITLGISVVVYAEPL